MVFLYPLWRLIVQSIVALVLLGGGIWCTTILKSWTLNIKRQGHIISDLVHALGLKWAFTSFRRLALEVLAFPLYLVVVNDKLVSVELFAVVVVLSSLGLVWGLKTNVSAGKITVLSFENYAGLEIAELSENTSKVTLSFILKAYHVQVALLLRRLVLEGFVLELFLAVFLAKGFADIQRVTPVVFAVEFSDGI